MVRNLTSADIRVKFDIIVHRTSAFLEQLHLFSNLIFPPNYTRLKEKKMKVIFEQNETTEKYIFLYKNSHVEPYASIKSFLLVKIQKRP